MTPKQRKPRPSSLGRIPPPRAPAKIRWIAPYYKDAAGEAPARDAMRAVGFPKNVRLALEARVKAVRDAPPPSFPAGSPVWSAMSKDKARGKVDMSGIFEIRDKHGDTLYRLFCLLDSAAQAHGPPGSRPRHAHARVEAGAHGHASVGLSTGSC